MSRIGCQPIPKDSSVKVSREDSRITVSGPLGVIGLSLPSGIEIDDREGVVNVKRHSNSKQAKSFHGLVRSLLNNAIIGVTQGFTKKLELHGIGYRVSLEGKRLNLNIGYSHPVTIEAPDGIEFNVQKNVILVKGIDKEKVGQISAKIREIRKPEPYKGKGIRYAGEYIRKKAGKTVKTAA